MLCRVDEERGGRDGVGERHTDDGEMRESQGEGDGDGRDGIWEMGRDRRDRSNKQERQQMRKRR